MTLLFVHLFGILLAANIEIATFEEANERKTVILVGPSGVGKSTIGNCIVNKDPSLRKTQSFPFATKNSANGCTVNSTLKVTDEFIVIDTVGFGDPNISSRKAFELFTNALDLVFNNVHMVLFVIQEGRMRRELVDFFRIFQEDVFNGRMVNNSVLICSKCKQGWLATNRALNKDLDSLLNKCNNRSFEFNLAFDVPGGLSKAEESLIIDLNREARNTSIHSLVDYLNRIETPNVVNLEYIKKDNFKQMFIDHISPRIQRVHNLINSEQESATKTNPYESKAIVQQFYSVLSTVVDRFG